jgi:hypothetical protein
MQQRQLRLGDILDDYCPRDRRVTNHAVVAMVGADVKRTRCTTCDAEHEYKGAKLPPQRKKKDAPPALYKQVLTGASKGVTPVPFGADQEPEPPAADRRASSEPAAPPSTEASEPPVIESAGPEADRPAGEEEGPVHRPLIRATLPRAGGAAPSRPITEFTIRQNGGRPGKFRPGTPHRQRAGGGGGLAGGGARHPGRPTIAVGRGGSRPSPSHPQRSAHHPHARVARPGKKRYR